MGLKLLSALLPSEYREQVLGDLAERGFRPRDVLNVLPRVWASHLRREWSGPIPDCAGDVDAMLARTEQLRERRIRRTAWTLGIAVAYVASLLGTGHMVWIAGLTAGLVFRLLGDGTHALPHLDLSEHKLLENYRRELKHQIATATSAAVILPVLVDILRKTGWLAGIGPGAERGLRMVSVVLMLAGMWFATTRRASRFQRELRQLDRIAAKN